MKILKILSSVVWLFAIFFFVCYQYGQIKEFNAPDSVEFFVDSGILNRPIPTLKFTIPITTLVVLQIINKSEEANIDPATALDIAICESRLDPRAKNKNSSAKGVYQIIDKTWKNYCTGDPLNPENNIDCFVKLYKKNPSWWLCK